MQWRPEFSFPGSPARGPERALPPRPRANPMAPRAGEEEIRWLQASRQGSPDYASGGSGTPSPQLWVHHEHHHRLYPASAGSSPSRAQAIAGYRREMLDLVRGLPESAYELSLRDIVEHPSSSPPPLPPPPSNTYAAQRDHEPADTKKDAAADTVDEQATKQSGGAKNKKQGRKQRTMRKQRSRSLERSVSLDTGLLIKLFLPLSVGGKKKVSPKPDGAKDAKKKDKEKRKQGKKEEAKEQEEEWWTKSEFSEAGSSSRTSSSNSGTGSVRNGHRNSSSNPRAPVRSSSRKRTGCYAFFRANKSKNGVSQE
ncbi:uncharacterized protein LOC133887478 [Phragmites australis]|uniref:uncharacterized protein LOC133887478 n=1 Tax=Phragmites australis TaxID=29695 RepID=UPI002D773868|nr:uncharacterized protein LOC133887478 [Phragmites australis]